jgi:large repetitive protein
MNKSAYSLCINLPRMIRHTGSQLRLAVAMLFALFACSMNVAHAQEAYAVGFESTVVYSGLNAPTGVAVDSLGNIYIADSASTVVYMETFQSNGTYVQSTIGTGLNKPYGVAVDSNFNVYISDTSNGRVLKETPAGGGTFTQTVIMAAGSNSYISSPTGIGVDINANVYVTDPTTGYVIRMTAGTWAVTEIAGYSTGLNDPYGVVVDSNLNIFIADIVSGVIEVPETCSLPAASSCVANIGTGIRGPKGVGVDAQNNIYIANTGSQQLLEEVLQYNGSYAQNVLAASSITTLNAVAVDPRYNIYVSVPGSNEVLELSPVNGNFGLVNIGNTSPTLTLTFDFLNGGEIGQILAVQKGATGSDFNIVSGGTCAAGSTYATGATCTVNVQFSPLYAGTRYGAIELINADSSPALFATAYIFGTGVGPQVIFLPGVDNFIYGNFGAAATLAVDGNDNVFVASQTVSYAYEFTAASGYTDAITLPGTYSNILTDVNVDGAGNVYITEWGSGICFKFFAADNYQTVISMDTAISEPVGSAVDGNGNVYVASQTGYDHEILAASDYTQIITLYTGSQGIADVAVDGAADVYNLNFTNGTVTEIVAVDGAVPANPTVNTIISGLTAGCCTDLESIKVDNVGNVYVADWATNSITEYYAASGFSTSAVVFPFTSASDMALDGQGNLWASSGTLEYVGELSTAAAPTLYFDATVVGQTSADSPQTVYVKNIGNETLNFPVEGSGNNPSISTGFTWNTSGSGDCPVATTSPQTLAVDAECAFPISFSPQYVGDTTGTLVLTDNALYNNAATQTINLNGTGTGPVMTVTADSYLIGSFGPAPALYYTFSGSLGSTGCTGAPSLSSNLPGSTPYPFTNPPIAGGVTPYIVTITAGTLSCPQYSSITYVNGKIEVGKNSEQLTLTTTNASMFYGQAVPNLASNYTLTGFQGSDTQATACTGAPSITTIATSSSPPGTYTITGDAGTLVCSSANYTYTISVVDSGVLTIKKDIPTISWTPVPASITYGTGLVAGQLDAIASYNSVNISADGTFAYTYLGNPISVGTILPGGSDSICVVWTPSAVYATDYSSSASTCTTITVGKASATLTLTTTNASMIYGSTPNVSSDYTLTGFHGSDTQANSCTGAPSLSTTATNTSPVSPPTYPITATIGTLSCSSEDYNYTVSITNSGAMTVTKAPLTITATPYATAVYDTAVPNSTFTYTITGWLGTDTQNNSCSVPSPGGVTLSTPATDGSPVGIYTINVATTMTCTNYYFVINTGELHITPAVLTIEPVSTTVNYAQQVPTYNYKCYLGATLEGTNNCGSIGITGGPTLTTTATIRATTRPGVVIYTSPIGSYTMNASLGSLKSTSGNYTFGFSTATLTIIPTTSDLTAKAGSYTINACAAVPTLTYTTSGYIDFDSAATQLTGTPDLQVLGLSSTCTAGTYTIQITAGTLAQTYGNYAGITYVNGTLTVR